ncbi:hypothetical protein H072_7502 [Dactylellina haptotyla CBS 200.50]|uniref:Deacetylase sirtuin-type domain-containing protein n=1 Tax=Dactylellina haptotyla (strain CBS 200.50) TaxID=1284197 RepID=S8A6Q8_DACHA|nr:hypothetical protein H072_7502 [Dactylellina haptotyla CBS 200.50]
MGNAPALTMLLRIPYTTPLPSFPPIPSSATTLATAVTAVSNFLLNSRSTLVLSGAGISVASGLPDYRGPQGTYTLNKEYRPIFYGDFVHKDAMRRRYWARSFLGWRGVEKVRPNRTHVSVGRLWEGGWVGGVITQNVDSLHSISHPDMPITNLHGLLSTLLCLTCRKKFARSPFQQELHRLNPTWSEYLEKMRSTPDLKIKRNPDGDIDVPGVEYEKFRYPPCQECFKNPVYKDQITVDDDGAVESIEGDGNVPGVMKPTLVFFGESLREEVKKEAEQRVDNADSILVLGSSLATYSAWRLVKRAKDQGKKVGIVNLGGVRGEDGFWDDGEGKVAARYHLGDGTDGVRVEFDAGDVLEGVLDVLERIDGRRTTRRTPVAGSGMNRRELELREIEMYAP